MQINKNIRLATEADSASILEIYSPYITDTVITFEYEVPTIMAFSKRITNIQKKYPWLLCEVNGIVVGYAYAAEYMQRKAYDWSVDFSIYINHKYHRKKIGKALYFALFELLVLQGYYNAYAGITLPNIKSEGLHQSFGFNPIGVYQNVGYKFDNWHDVKWFQLKIQDCSKSPTTPKTINDINNTPEFNTIIQKARQLIMD